MGGLKSLSARRAWIEIYNSGNSCTQAEVALRKESVDRNSVAFVFGFGAKVALRKESVDRNTHKLTQSELPNYVALRKESVDRNLRIRVVLR